MKKIQNIKTKCYLDANDFTWANAKASHVVILYEMERGWVTGSDTSHIDLSRELMLNVTQLQ